MKKKLLTLGLSSTLSLSSVLPAFADTIQTDDTINKTSIETAIGLKFPETKEDLEARYIKANLSGNGVGIEIDLNSILKNPTKPFNVEGYTISSEIIQDGNKIKTIKFKVDGLDAKDGYKLEVTGKNYTKTTIDLSTATYSKRINISTASNLLFGDVNKDNKVDINDITLLEENINTENSEIDLNNDGKITIADIAIINSNMTVSTDAIIIDTEMVPSYITNKIDINEFNNIANTPENNVASVEGEVNDLFNNNSTSVKFTATETQDNVSIPLEFTNTVEMSSVEVKIPTGVENTEISLYDEDGQVISVSDTPAVAAYSMTRNNNENVVVVNLGARKPVKKIVISAKPTEDGYVEVEQIKIIGDIISDEIVQDNKVKQINAIPSSEKVDLSWSPVNNAIGYKVYYGTDKDNLTQTTTSNETKITISSLENLKTYYFAVSTLFAGANGEVEGNRSTITSATPKPESKPLKPDFVEAVAKDKSITLSWKATENATSYNIYGKTANEQNYTKMASNITDTSYSLTNLQNDVEYTLYVTSVNSIGESEPSNLVNATPKKDEILIPTLPTLDKIPNTNIESVKLERPEYYNPDLYPNGFKTEWFVDGDFNTSWVARRWYDSTKITFTFNEPKDMNYLVWVPRLDSNYRDSFDRYTIEVWKEGDDLNQPGKQVAVDKKITNRVQQHKQNDFFIFDFPKQEKVKQIAIQPIQWNGSPTNMNASEVAFYEYNDIGDRVSNLFANSSRTKLNQDVTIETINSLKEEVNKTDGFVVDKDILLKELDIATSLVNNNTENLGIIKDDIFSINPTNDSNKYSKAINNWQPLGVVGRANEKVTIFADIPKGEQVYLVPTQFYEEANKLSAEPILLQNGRNVINIPKIGQNYYDRGGSLYVTYNGTKANEIKLQVIGGYDIPYLELSNLHSKEITEEKVKQKITQFINELEAYVPTLQGNLKHQNLNQVEIALPNVLLSLPADKVLEGIKSGSSDKVQNLYDNVQAWEELMGIMYKTYGIDDHKNDSLETRHNIRYMQMFANAFMYASGNHVGIGYESVAPLMTGKPVTPGQTSPNSLFGWGIAHEIGHVMDAFGKAEVTNNIYSLIGQTYDGDKNILPSRLEGGAYEGAFKKVSVGGEGVPNDLFVNLAMYWQLHLAYDDKDSTQFYNQVHKLYRTDETVKSFNGMDKFAVAASKVAQKDLTEFFTRWGVVLSDSAKNTMVKTKEERAIYYLTDESRRVRLNNSFEGSKNITVTATATLEDENTNTETDKTKSKKVTINITNNSGVSDENIQGYEILRKSASDNQYKSIGFTTTNTYTDYIGSANNMVFEYAVKPIDILGNVSPQVDIKNQVRISYDNTIDTNLYNLNKDNNTVTVNFNSPTTITGVKITPIGDNPVLQNGKVTVYGNIAGENSPVSAQVGETLIKEIDFSKNNFASDKSKAYLTYFNKPGSTDDKIWAYDVNSLRLDGFDFTNYNIEFLSYPGDNVEFMEMGIGRLANDYTYDSIDDNGQPTKETIAKDSLVIVGKYRGNSAFSNIYINGKYPKQNSLSDNIEIETRPVSGYTLMFDTVDENGKITSSTAEGIFIFVPDLQKDNLGEEHEKLSQLPTEIMAEMWNISFNENGTVNKNYRTSDTTWISMPTDESLPKIVLQGEQKNLKVDFK